MRGTLRAPNEASGKACSPVRVRAGARNRPTEEVRIKTLARQVKRGVSAGEQEKDLDEMAKRFEKTLGGR